MLLAAIRSASSPLHEEALLQIGERLLLGLPFGIWTDWRLSLLIVKRKTVVAGTANPFTSSEPSRRRKKGATQVTYELFHSS